MSKNHKFRRLFFVIEACYSGSVAKNISIPNVLFLSAAGPTQSSYSADWDCDVDAFRTNEFTKHFVNYILQNPDSKIIDCVNVSQGTMRSHVCAYGDFKVSKAKLSDFLMEAKPIFYHDDETNSQVESNGEDNKKSFIAFLQRKASKTNGPERLELEILLEKERLRRKQSSQAFKNIANKFVSNGGKYLFDDTLDDINYQCYRTAVEGFRLFCGEVDEHEMPKLRVFGNLCKISNSTTLLTEIHEVCPQKLWENSQLFI